jgi:hypothetical protein
MFSARSGRSARRGGLAIVAALVLLAGCTIPPDVRAARELASTISIEGYRKAGEDREGEGTHILFFVGPSDIDLATAVSARGWSPEPAPPGLPDNAIFTWILYSRADTDQWDCSVMFSTLRPDMGSSQSDLTDEEKRQVEAGELTYVKATCHCYQP